MDVMTLAAKLTLNTSEFNSGLETSEKKMSGMASGAVTLGNLTTQAINAAGRAVKGFAEDTVNTGKEFDAAMSQVRAIKDMTDEEYDKVRKKAMELGETTKFTASEVAEGLYYMGLAGWDVDEMLAGIGPMLDLAAASGENLGKTSDIVTDALTAFGLSASDTQHFVDVLAAASANSNTTVSQMGQAFKYLAANAGVLNYSIDDVAVTLGLLANNGIKSSQAGTSMRQIINSLIAPTDKAAAAMESLGLYLFEAGTDKVKPLNQVLREMREIFRGSDFDLGGKPIEEIQAQLDEIDAWYDEWSGKVNSKGKIDYMGQIISQSDLDKMYQSKIQETTHFNETFLANLKDIGGLRGISSIISIMKSTDDDFEQLVSAVENSEGAAGKMADTMLNNLEGDITIMQSALEGLKIIVSDSFKEDLRSFVQALTEEIGNLNEAFQQGGVVGMFANLVDWMVNGITNALMDDNVTGEQANAFGKALGDMVGRLVNRIVTNAPELLTGLFNAGMSIAGGLIEGLFAGLFGTGAGTIPGMILGIEDAEQEAINEANGMAVQAQGILEYMDGLKDKYGEAAENTEEWAAAFERLQQVYPQINEYIKAQGGELSTTNQELQTYIQNTKDQMIEDAKRAALQSYVDAYTESLKNMGMAQIQADLATAQAAEAKQGIIDYIKQTQGEGFTGEGMSMQQLMYAAYATANELGDSSEYVKNLEEIYNTQTSVAAEQTAKFQSLQDSTALLKQQMDIASSALASLASEAGSFSAGEGYESYGQWKSRQYGHAKGLWTVPYDDYAASLHRGEMVLTASQARKYKEGSQMDLSGLEDRIIGAIKAGMADSTVNSYLDGKSITDAVSRQMAMQMASRRFG